MANIFDLFKQIEKKDEARGPITEIVVGLGNPGLPYRNTRHNAGFVALDALASECGAACDRAKFHALVGEAALGGRRVLLMKPQTYMNSSGTAVREAADFYKIAPDHIYVLSDDISLAPGRMRLRRGGSAGGHNGLKSIIECLGSDAFPRIKYGVGAKPYPEMDLAEWVLGVMPEDDANALKACAKVTRDALTMMLDGKTEEAMGKYNGFVGTGK